jgi:hypothetical protein
MSDVKRYDKVWREEEYKTVKDVEGPFVLIADYEKLERKVARLEKRLLAKKRYETEDLVQRGATAQFIKHIDDKDQAAMKD